MYAKYVNNQQHEERAVKNGINKIALVKSSMNCTYLCVSWSLRRNVCPYCWKICDKIKRQPLIVVVYRLLKRQMYCKYLNNIQYEGPAVRCRLRLLQRKMYAKYVKNQQRECLSVCDAVNKIAVVKSSMNRTYLCVGWSQRFNVCPYCWRSMRCNQMITVNSRGLSVVRTENVL